MKTERNDSASAERPAPETPTALSKAMDYYRAALQDGPRLARDVLAEGKRLGHTRRTQERARSQLNVQTIPPTTWQGPWLIVLPGHPAIDESKQRREEKKQKKQLRRSNQRGTKMLKGGVKSQSKGEVSVAAR